MVLKFGFYISKGLYIDTASKVTKGEEVILLGFRFLNHRINCIMLWKGIRKSDIMLQGIYPTFDIQVGSSQNCSYKVS